MLAAMKHCIPETYPQDMERNVREWANYVEVQCYRILRHLGGRLFVLLFDVGLCTTANAVSKPITSCLHTAPNYDTVLIRLSGTVSVGGRVHGSVDVIPSESWTDS
jgi:hypothetical protein